MHLAIISDTHSNYDAVERALDMLRARDIDHVLHCGDICDAPTVSLFRGFTTHFVLGNCDDDLDSLRQAIADAGHILQEPFGHLELDGTKLAFVHGDDASLLQGLEHSGEFAYVFHGHSHVAGERKVGATRVINPGALYRVRQKTFAVLDIETGALETLTLE